MSPCPWTQLEPGHIAFCEARLDGWIVEPANAWSSLAYVAAGVYVASRVLRARAPTLLLVGATAVLIGVGSFAFHATGTFAGEFADESSMFLLSALLLVLALRRLFGWRSAQCALAFACLAGASVLALACAHGSGVALFTFEVAIAVAIEMRLWFVDGRQADRRALAAAFAFFGVGYVAWWLDLGGVVCEPRNHAFGGHALWHTLSALSLVWYERFQEQFFAGTCARPSGTRLAASPRDGAPAAAFPASPTSPGEVLMGMSAPPSSTRLRLSS